MRFLALIVVALSLAGCGLALEATREYEYRTVQHPDGTLEKFVSARIKNSDMSLGVLKAEAADGTKLEINDLTAEERVSAANQTLAEGMKTLADKAPDLSQLPVIP